MICKECGLDVGSLGMHIKHKHGMNAETYYNKHIALTNGICKTCGKPTKFIGIEKGGYRQYCSVKCMANSKEIKDKREQTNLRIRGVKYNLASAENREKQYETCLKKFGTKFPQQLDSIKEKAKTTNLERHGAEWFVQTDEFKEKTKQNCLMKSDGKYTWTSQFPETIEKRVAAFKENHEQWLNHFTETCNERYGVNNPMQVPEIRKRSQHKYTYNGINFDSSAELAYYIWLTDNDIKFDYQPDVSFSFSYNGKDHSYQPDFLVDGKYIELKGAHFFENDRMINPYDRTQDGLYEAKHQCMIANNVQIITDFSSYQNYVDEKYTKDFLQLFRNDLPFPYINADLSDTSDLGVIHHFHKSIYEASRKNTISPLLAWKNKELVKKCALNRLKYVKKCRPCDILQGFNVAKIAPKVSLFKPALAERLINTYLAEYDTIFDPFSGFSGRMIGCENSGKKYIGQDINEKHISEGNEIIAYKNYQNSVLTVQNVLTDTNKKFACLFTCPPYGGKEHWNINNDEVEKTCDEWIDICLEKYDCESYLFVVDETDKYKYNIVETITNKSHFGINNEYVIFIRKSSSI